ncbi:GrpB family protein [Piscibacillus sp. B03]|uniref:GrpB family protein n=1 Tax=Piscibacillus sp. B03 TaxID=3457430 RepID=UPI003FCD6A3C
MLGLQKGEVKLVPHNPEWTTNYQQEKALLESLVGEYIVGIEHIGSTAINGIKAKPIIDIMIGLQPLDNARDLELRTMQEGHYYRLQKQQLEGKVVFAKFPEIHEGNAMKTHFLHVVEYDGDWWHEHIQFRDRLNNNLELAKEYEQLKLNLAEQHSNDVKSYTDQKLEFVKSIID